MIILGIDPGFSVTGYSLLKKEQKIISLLDAGYLKLPATKPLQERIKQFHATIEAKIISHKVTHLALETPFLGKNAATFLKLGYLRGIMYLLAANHQLQVLEFSPREVKATISGFGGAGKEQVAAMVMRLFPGVNKFTAAVKADVTDAIAVGLCGAWKS